MGSLLAGQKMRASALQITNSRYYSNDTTTTLAGSGTRMFLSYNVTDISSPNVTPSGTGNNLFTMNKAGIWIIEASMRFLFLSGLPTTGDVILEITGAAASPVEGGRTVPTPIPLAGIPQAAVIREYSAGGQVQVRLSNFTDKTLTLSNSLTHLAHISLTWLQGP